MLLLKNIHTIDNQIIDFKIVSERDITIDAKGLTLLPAVIDPHVHFRTPGLDYKEDWRTGAKAAIRGGCTMVFDMPNTKPPTFTQSLLTEKKALIDSQLAEIGYPLRYQLFFGADKHHINEITLAQSEVIGIKVFMGCSTGNLVIDDDKSLEAVFALAAKLNMLIAVHAEDEHLIRERRHYFSGTQAYAAHSEWRNIEVATRAVNKAINLTERYGTRLYLLHVSSVEEVDLIRTAKQKKLPVYAETTPHHLFFDTQAYETLQGRAVVNPPLRAPVHRTALLSAIHEGIIDTIGSDHAPHTIAEKAKPYGECPSGMPGIEFMLPLLLNAHHEAQLSLQQIVSLTSARAREIFQLPAYNDWVIVDLSKAMQVKDTYSKCGWTPYHGRTLRGWPVYTIMRGQCYETHPLKIKL